jgi:hypothetical protein
MVMPNIVYGLGLAKTEFIADGHDVASGHMLLSMTVCGTAR